MPNSARFGRLRAREGVSLKKNLSTISSHNSWKACSTKPTCPPHVAELVARKQAGEELAVAPPVEAFTRFLEAELPRLEARNEPDDAAGDVDELNSFFRRYALAA